MSLRVHVLMYSYSIYLGPQVSIRWFFGASVYTIPFGRREAEKGFRFIHHTVPYSDSECKGIGPYI